MSDVDSLPLDELESGRNLPISQQAECLLAIVAPMLHAMQAAQSGKAETVLELHESKQVLRESIESLCRPLSSEEIQQLFATTLITLGERLTSQG